jgi:hypothetical protein
MRMTGNLYILSKEYARPQFLVLFEMNHKNEKRKVKSSDRPDRQRATPQRQENVDISNDVPGSKVPVDVLPSGLPCEYCPKSTMFCANAFSSCSRSRTDTLYARRRTSGNEASQVMP